MSDEQVKEFERIMVSISGAPEIKFVFSGDRCRAWLAGAVLEGLARDDHEVKICITDASGEMLCLVVAHKVASDENITETTERVGSALLWSHWRWRQAQEKAR